MESKNSPEIKFTETLLDYGVEILVAFATDSANRKLFALALGQTDNMKNPYLVVHVGDEIATRLKNGNVDALSAILTPETKEWLIVDFVNGDHWEVGEIVKVYTNPEEIPQSYLPGHGLFL